MPEALETNLALGQAGNSSAGEVDAFRASLLSISGGSIDVTAMVEDAAAFTRVKAGTINYAFGSPTGAYPGNADHLIFTHEFGMEMAEFHAWWFEGGGEPLFNGILASEGVKLYPLALRASESGGWFKEALTLEKLEAGVYDSGLQMRFRAFGTHQGAWNRAFPLVVTPGVVAGSTEIEDILNGNFNGGEFSEPKGDASTVAGLWPNFPDKEGSPVDAGLIHYYVGSYHTPFRMRALLINTGYLAGLTASERDMIDAAALVGMTRNMADSMQGGDAIIKTWQGHNVVVHRELPPDIQSRFRKALEDEQDARALADADYATILTSQRDFCKANGVRWSTLPDRRQRFARTAYDSTLKADAAF
jgi:TRAP-type mannitol/chloroaromatic compound transport system substrate-binding protein